MPQETNNTTPNQNQPSGNPPAQQGAVPQQNQQQPQEQKIASGALNKALLRTFKGDAEKELGPNASNEAVKNFVPKGVPLAQQQPPAQTPAQPAQPREQNKAVVHTFKDDVQNLVRNKKVSMARMAALESDRGPQEQTAGKDPGPWRTTAIVGLIALFLTIGGVLGVATYYSYQLNTAPNLTPQFEPAIIFTEAREQIDTTDKDARAILATLSGARRNTFESLGSVVDLRPTKLTTVGEAGQEAYVPLDANDFLAALGVRAPDTFLQTLGADYIIGVHTLDENVPFLILTTQSYGHAFSGMLKWEQYIEEDFTPFFSPNAEYVRPAVAEGDNMFADTVIENQDVRILRDANEQIRLLYTFIGRNAIVITTNIRTLKELVNRLRVAEF